MRLQLDTTKKTIKVEESVKLSKLIDTLKKLLPNNEWKEFTLETNTTISYWNSPTIIKEYPTYPDWPKYPWYYGSSTTNCDYKNEMNALQLKSGTYNVEV